MTGPRKPPLTFEHAKQVLKESHIQRKKELRKRHGKFTKNWRIILD